MGERRWPQLDVVRGLAIVMVVVYHGIFYTQTQQPNFVANQITRVTQFGALGVNLFFVLSGFLITGNLLDRKGSADYFSNFYLRRALRILPAYLLTLVVLIALRMISRGGVAASLTFLSNYNVIPAAPKYGPFWSLSVEEQFYLVWPVVVLAVSRRWLGWIAGAIWLGDPLLRGALVLGFGEHDALVNSATFLIGDHFALGALAALLVRSRWGTRRIEMTVALLMLTAAVAIVAGGLHHGLLHGKNALDAALRAEPFELAFTALLLGGLAAGEQVFAGQIFFPLRWLGDISYGLYLAHMIVFAEYDRLSGHGRSYYYGNFRGLLVRLSVCGGIAVALAWVSRRFYEERFLRMKDRLVSRQGHGNAGSRNEADLLAVER